MCFVVAMARKEGQRRRSVSPRLHRDWQFYHSAGCVQTSQTAQQQSSYSGVHLLIMYMGSGKRCWNDGDEATKGAASIAVRADHLSHRGVRTDCRAVNACRMAPFLLLSMGIRVSGTVKSCVPNRRAAFATPNAESQSDL